MFADVVLYRRLPQNLDSFTYEVPKNFRVERGQIVEVPFRKQKLSGVVRKIHKEKPAYPTKFIEKAFSFVLPSWQMELANWMSDFYQCSFTNVIHLFLPKNIWCVREKKPVILKKMEKTNKAYRFKNKEKLHLEIKNFVQQLLSSPKKKLVLEKCQLPREIFYQSIMKNFSKNSQILFLFPEFFHSQRYLPNLPIFHSGLKEKEKVLVWNLVYCGSIEVLSGTRTALFLPFQKLSAIVLDFEHSESYFEKRQPPYSTLQVGEKIADILKIPLIVISASPNAETYHRYEKFIWGEKKSPAHIKIIDMKNECRKGNFSIFAQESIEKIARNLSQKKQILLFLNRRGEASALFCPDCSTVFRCEQCAAPLTLHSHNELHCHRCRLKEKIPKQCRTCGNVKLKPLGLGTERIEKEIQKIFSKARLLRLDRETIQKKKQIDEKILQRADIIIATKIIDKPFKLPRLNISIAVLPDQLLNFPFFRACERAFQLLTHIKNLTKEEMLIQTFLPDHFFYQYLSQNRLEDFYEKELETRKNLSLPPFTHQNQ